MRNTRLFISASAICVCAFSLPIPASAYVDPGIVSTFVQGIFVVLAGGAAAWVTRPWEYFRSKLRRDKQKPTSEDPELGGTDTRDE